jgi:predicted oxidoreductase
MVDRVALGEGGPSLSRLCHGTWRLLREPTPPSPARLGDRLAAAADLGITTVDTAEIYGNYGVEELLGAAFAQAPRLRPRLEIVTKFGIYVPNARHPERTSPFYNASAARVVASVDKSLRLLGTDVIDLLLVHRPDWLTPAAETARGLEDVVKAGKVRHVGVSNYNVHQLELLRSVAAVPLVTNQIELSLLASGALFDGTLDQCQRHRMRPMAWSPLAGGRLFAADDAAGVRLRAALEALAPKYADPQHGPPSAAALALAWVLAHPAGPVAVVGTSRPDRMAALARATDVTLDRHDWYLLWQAAAGRKIP